MLRKDYGDTNFITGMRAYAALAVVFIHSGGGGLVDWGSFGKGIVNLGRTGPYVFFVISGYSVASSFSRSKTFGAYIRKRLWRIVPLYYVWLGVGCLLGGSEWLKAFHVRLDAYNVILHGAFLSFADYRIANSILGVEWSIPIEVFWYFLLPALTYLIASPRTAAVFMPALFAVYAVLIRLTVAHAQGNMLLALQWSPVPYFFSYALGVSAFRWRPLISRSGWVGDAAVLGAICSIPLYVMNRPAVHAVLIDEHVVMALIAFLLILLGSSESKLCNLLLTRAPVLYLGTISYGIYLCHFALRQVLFESHPVSLVTKIDNATFNWIFLTTVSVLVASLSYVLIERPALAFSRRHESDEVPKSVAVAVAS